jgi:hypothetical protein
MLATGTPILNAIGSSLGATSYAFSGFVAWPLALLFVARGRRWRFAWRATGEEPFLTNELR